MSNANVSGIISDIITVLNTKLTDPYVTAGGSARTFVHKDNPLGQATYPRIQVVKGSKENDIISMNYSKNRTLLINIFFHTKKGFKVTIDGTTYKEESLIEYYLDLIEDILDTHRDSISGTWGLKTASSDQPIYLPDTNCYVGMCTVRLFYFKIGV